MSGFDLVLRGDHSVDALNTFLTYYGVETATDDYDKDVKRLTKTLQRLSTPAALMRM